ncbi:hypothetical protein MIMGU_mgv1a012396mg [Erythranthe guttata]|uniref:RRM domain-containing protein n=1 Tax=Erythranthe guttata TaxID=4155 RepID=A0A022Q2K4_ERYGU|nr:hypothetical protein MIMGU_mgv1a012396mg [Erythranthe guttata]
MAHPPPYEPYYLAPPLPDYGYSTNDGNGINTLFVSGLPDDVKAREIHNLFRRRPGFESCQLKYTGRGNQGVKFDPETGLTLHIELARSNSRRKHKPGSGPYVVIDLRTKSGADARETSSDDDDGSDENVDAVNQDDSAADKSAEQTTTSIDAFAPDNDQAEKTSDGACSTLFIANLGPNCTEDELKQVLSLYPGFNSLKIRARGGMPVAFADFEKVEQATHAINALQGSTLASSDRGGMHIEYARSKMRKP